MMHSGGNGPDISVIVPIKDEVENIVPVYEAVKKALEGERIDFELIYVDDGSTDGSLERIKEVRGLDKRTRWLSFDRNYGQTAAWQAGFLAANGRLVATMDGDLQNDPIDYPRMIMMIGDNCDVVCGIRTKRRDSLVRRISSRIGNGFRNWLTGKSVKDVGCSLRVFKRECVENLPLFEGMHRFFPTLIQLQGYRIQEIPVKHRSRERGKTKYGINNRLWCGIADCFAVFWMRRRWIRYRVLDYPEKDT